LLNRAEFAKFTLDEWPTLVWSCGFDLAPEMLYERVTGKQLTWQQEQAMKRPVDIDHNHAGSLGALHAVPWSGMAW